jgi:hypothetical protein
MWQRLQKTWKQIAPDQCELEGPYECPHCGYHVMLDVTYLAQVAEKGACPGCKKVNKVPPEQELDLNKLRWS